MTGLLLVGLVAAVVPPGAGPAQAAGGFSQTKTVTREIMAEDGTVSVDERTVTVNADVTTDLRGRQVMTVRWSGAHPSGGIYGDTSAGDAWVATEYPVVVLQCRGDDSSPDPAAHIRPETCWTTQGAFERRWDSVAGTNDYFRHDKYVPEAERAQVSVPAADDWARVCNPLSFPGSEMFPTWVVPFVAADGTEFWTCGGDPDPGRAPEMRTSGSGTESTTYGPNEKVSYTTNDGSGATTFEVRTAAENASLGCSATVPCAVVVIPVMGISCDEPDQPGFVCNQEGLRPPGSNFNPSLAISGAVVGQYWASASNWRNRITIPIQIAPSDAICTDTDGRFTFQLYGSSLMYQAAEQWTPDYCSRPDRFVLRVNDQVETTAFNSLNAGYGSGVLATYATPSSSVPLGYAPVGLTGFAIGFVIDIPGGGGQLEQLNLNPRLLAKLLTASYWGTSPSETDLAERPDLAGNPRSLQQDPEFLALNPALDVHSPGWDQAQFSFSQLMGLSVPSDLTMALTSYIAADPEAMEFIDGATDPWGMHVNRAYEGLSLPLADWPLTDPWTHPDPHGCDAEQPIPWFTKVLAPVSDLHRLAVDLLSATPEAIYLYDYVPHSDVCKTYRLPAMPQGSRAMLALVTLADARRYAIPTASLRTTSDTYVAPTDASLTAAAALMTSAGPGEPFVPDAARLVAAPTAYPGTMVVHAALPLSGADHEQAAAAASFVRIATTEGQIPGTKSGQLAAGYAPITATGPTAPLYASAQAVADAVERQSGSVADTALPQAADDTADAGLDWLDQVSSSLADLAAAAAAGAAQAAGPDAVAGLPAPEATATTTPRRGLTPQALFNALRAALPAGLALTAAAAVGVPVLRRYRVER